MKLQLPAVVALCCLVLSGCSSIQNRASRPALIGHIVFVELNDFAHYPEILADSDSLLATIPSVSKYAAGSHVDTGRATVSDDYDLAIYLGFESVEALAEYVDHDQHIEYVRKWKPKLKSLRIYDMLDPSQ